MPHEEQLETTIPVRCASMQPYFSYRRNGRIKKLMTEGPERSHLSLPGRYTASREIFAQYEEMKKIFHEVFLKQVGRSLLRLTYTQTVSRGYLCVTGHYLNSSLRPRAPLLGITYLAGVMLAIYH